MNSMWWRTSTAFPPAALSGERLIFRACMSASTHSARTTNRARSNANTFSQRAIRTSRSTHSPARLTPRCRPFAATGRHFLSVQPVINYWYWWSANSGAPHGEAFYFRDNAAGEAWHHGDSFNNNMNADVEFSLYGTVTSGGHIDSLSETTLPRSGFLEIFGSNFGGDGTVLIGGISAPVADWTSTRIIAYVPESAPLATLPVQVVNGGGSSNTVPLAVTTRPVAADHVNWRFRMNGPYSFVRPAIGPDGTVYSVDAFHHLYALTPDGGLKWLVRGAGDKGVAVGSDGTIYVASESFINAYNPDGSAKWQFVQNPRAFICLGVSVGPDGNIYSVGTEGMGVFSLTPAGALRWQTPEAYDRRIVEYAEILFGQNGGTTQLYFAANNHLRALRLDGSSVFTIAGWYGQPAIGPDGSVHSPLSAYSPSGNLLWTFQSPYPYNVFPPPDVGSNGIHYFGQNLSQLFALNPNGSQRWHATLNAYVDGPVVDSLNTQLSWAAPTRSITPASFSPPAPRTGRNSGALSCQRKTRPFGTLGSENSVSTNSPIRAHDSPPTARLPTSSPGQPRATTTLASPSSTLLAPATARQRHQRASSRAKRTEQREPSTLICRSLATRGSSAAAVERIAITKSCLRFRPR